MIISNQPILRISLLLSILLPFMAQSQSLGFDQFMGVNVLREDPIEKASCVSFAREFHFWNLDQGKRVQLPGSTACTDYLIDLNDPVAGIYELYDLSDVNLTTIIGTYNKNNNTLTLGVNNYYVYYDPEFDYQPTYKHIRICYAFSEYCFNQIDDDGDGLVDCDDTAVCDCTMGSPDYPNQKFRWNPPYQNQGQVNFDYFYDVLQGQGLTISPSMTGSLAKLSMGPDYPNRIPIQWSGKPTAPIEGTDSEEPSSYRERADWMYHYLVRYANGSPLNACEAKFHDDESDEISRGNISYIESWNEPDRFWEGDAAKFSPQQYAAMASCDYDGHEGTLTGMGTDCNNNAFSYNLGVSQFGIPFVMGAPYEVGTGVWDTWVVPMNDWFASNRTDDLFVFDVLNFHHYSATDINNGDWICPEEDGLKSLLEGVVSRRDNAPWAAGKELWLSEFGYSTGGAGPGLPGNDGELTQAQWIARSFLEIAAAGFDRAMVHDLSDAFPFTNPGAWDTQTGLLTDTGDPKTSWYFVYSLKNILGGRQYDGQLPPSGCNGYEFDGACTGSCERVYKFTNGDPCETIYAIWNPSACGYSNTYDLPLQCGNVATGIQLVDGSTSGREIPLNVNMGKATVPVSETPIFVIERQANPPTCPSVVVEETDCNSVTLALNDLGQSFDSYHIWYGLANGITDPNNPDFSPFQSGEIEQFQHDVPGDAINAIVSGLQPSSTYYIYVIPQGANGIPNDYCKISVTTTGSQDFCALPITNNMIISDTGDPNFGSLFDDQQGNFDFCILDDLSGSQPWLNFSGSCELVLDLGKYYQIDQFNLLDGTSAGVFSIEGNIENNAGTYEPLLQYFTDAGSLGNEWVTLSNFEQPIDGYRYLRFTNPDAMARINEALICGREACLLNDDASSLSYCMDYEPRIVLFGLGCNSLEFWIGKVPPPPQSTIQMWISPDGPFDENEHPEVTYSNAISSTATLNPNAPGMAAGKVRFNGLQTNTNYWFAYRVLDGEGRSSRLYVGNKATRTLCWISTDGFTGPTTDKDCMPNGIWMFTSNPSAGGYYDVVETAAQTTTPFSSAIKTATIPIDVSNDTYYYYIDWNDQASASTNWLYHRRVYADMSATSWNSFNVKQDTLCGDGVDGRSANAPGNVSGVNMEKAYLFPNPAANEISLVLGSTAFHSFSIFSVAGKLAGGETFGIDKQQHVIDISHLPSGFYYLKLYSDSTGSELLKFVVR